MYDMHHAKLFRCFGVRGLSMTKISSSNLCKSLLGSRALVRGAGGDPGTRYIFAYSVLYNNLPYSLDTSTLFHELLHIEFLLKR